MNAPGVAGFLIHLAHTYPVKVIGGLAAFAGVALVVFGIRYELDEDSLCIKSMGIRLRRILIEDIESVSPIRSFWSENWFNTLSWHKPDRVLTIRRRSGLFRNVQLTPKNRDAFMEEIRRHPRYWPNSGVTNGRQGLGAPRA